MKVALFGGSFDPIHNGHIAIANYMVQATDIDELWFLLSPQNPLKTGQKQSSDQVRLAMLQRAIANNSQFKICDIECSLPKPNYTIDTLHALTKQYPDIQFSLVIGEDNLAVLTHWKDYQSIIEQHIIYVYPRHRERATFSHPNIVRTEAPLFDVSSTEIRQRCQQGRSIAHLVPHEVATYIAQNKLYL